MQGYTEGGTEGGGGGKKIIHMPEDKCIFSTCLLPCPHPPPLFHLSLFPHFVFLGPATLFLLPLSCLLLSGRLTRNDRAFCHGVWNSPNITCQPRDDNGWHGVEGYTVKKTKNKKQKNDTFYFSLLPSLFKSHYRLTGVFFFLAGSQ